MMSSSDGQELEREHLFDSSSSSLVNSSEMGSSHYSTESGVSMPGFAAIVLLSGAVTLGVSLLALIIALTAMLQSCQKKNPGILEYHENYGYCKNLAFHAELNGLSPDNEICKGANEEYIEKGHYERDLSHSILIIEDFFDDLRKPRDDYAIMMDADDLVFDATFDSRLINEQYYYYLKRGSVLNLYLNLRSRGWHLVLFSRKPETMRNGTVELLASAGCGNWSSLVMRKENGMHMSYEEYLSGEKVRLHAEGLFRIAAVISSRIDALRTRKFGEIFFKIPNPIFLDYHQAQKI